MKNALFGIGVVAVIMAAAVPSSFAQCPMAREFGAQGSGIVTNRIKIDNTNCPHDGNEVGGLWVAEHPQNNNQSAFFGGPDTMCPTNTWWITGTTFLGPMSGIQGFISAPGCSLNFCPAEDESLVTVVEDVSANGSDACTIIYVTPGTPWAVRFYDHGQTEGLAYGGVYTHVFEYFPWVEVIAPGDPPPNPSLFASYRDVVINFHGHDGVGNPTPASQGILSYDILWFHGPAEPGRQRADWQLLKSVPYNDMPVDSDLVSVPCPTQDDDTYLAVGLEYVGGVSSVLVGRATAVECASDGDDGGQDVPATGGLGAALIAVALLGGSACFLHRRRTT